MPKLLEQLKIKMAQGFTPHHFSKKSGGGFTLIEVIISIFLLTVGVLGAFTAIQQVIVFTDVVSSRLEAIYLGQEGIEIARNIRDGNWLEARTNPAVPVPWNDGLTHCSGGCEADYNDLELFAWQGDGRFLRINGGFFNYDSGPETAFKRKIIITLDGADILRVSAEVSWQERGRSHEVAIEGRLHRWLR